MNCWFLSDWEQNRRGKYLYHEFNISRGPPTLFAPTKAFSPAAPDLLDLVTANQLNEQTAPNWFPILDFLLSFL